MDVAGSAVGIASLGIQICQGLLAYYDGWKDYEPDIASAKDSIIDLHETLVLLKDNLEAGSLEAKRTERVKSCLKSCEGGLKQLSDKLGELQKHENPSGFRQKARAQMQRSWYPFRKDTLARLRDNVADIRERLKLALHVLQLAVQTTDRWRKIVNWLSPPDPWVNHHAARQRYEPQTGTWLLQSDEYRKWKAGGIRHLWLYGKAGCGKTVLSSTVIEDLLSHSDDAGNVGLGIFFFTFSDVRKQSYADFLLSLVAQLGWNKPAIGSLQQAYEKQGRGMPSSDDLEKILLASLDPYTHVLLALDALDESPEENDHRSTLLRKLEDLSDVAPKLKLFATSRDIGDIRDGMMNLKAHSVPIVAAAVDKDIEKYVATQLARDRKLSQLNVKSKDMIKKTLTDDSDGMFRWVDCQLQELKKLRATKPKYIEETLRALPKTLDGTYERMLASIPEMCRREAHTLLQWIAYSVRPVTLAQLSEASIVDPDAKIEVDTDNRGELEDTLEILAGLVSFVHPTVAWLESSHVGDWDAVSVDDEWAVRTSQPPGTDNLSTSASIESVDADTDVVDAKNLFDDSARVLNPEAQLRLAHFSVLEYLESDRIHQSIVRDFLLDLRKGHRLLAQSCLAYLEFYSKNVDKTSTRKDAAVYPLIEYAAQQWHYHARHQESGTLTREISLLTSENLKRDWLTVWQPDSYDPWRKVNDVGSALYYAAYLDLHDVSRALIEAHEDVNALGGLKGYPLHAASGKGHGKIVQCLLEAGANVDAVGRSYSTALHAASQRRSEAIVSLLIAADANIDVLDKYGRTPLTIAASSGELGVVQMLLDAGADVNRSHTLVGAAEGGDLKIIQMLLDAGADVNAGDALARAAYHGHSKVIQTLLDAGADVNAGDALVLAAREGRSEVVPVLLDAGADVNAGNALAEAVDALRASPEVVQMLLNAGADVNAGAALTVAAREGYSEVVQMLLDAGADVNAGDALAVAAGTIVAHPGIVQMLLDAGADTKSSRALQKAAFLGRAKIVQQLLHACADVNDGPDGQYSESLFQARQGWRMWLYPLNLEKVAAYDEIEAILLAAGAKENLEETRHWDDRLGAWGFHIDLDGPVGHKDEEEHFASPALAAVEAPG